MPRTAGFKKFNDLGKLPKITIPEEKNIDNKHKLEIKYALSGMKNGTKKKIPGK